MKKTIDSYLANIIKESVRSTLNKRHLNEEADEPTSSKQDEKDKLKKGDITPDDIIEKLNTIRAGRSFKDDAISASLEKYVDGMSSAEKTALFAFLKGISQIVTGEFEPEAALEPSDKPAGVEMKKSSSPDKIKIKPVVVTKKQESEPKKPSAEDTSGPVPIKAKKK